MKKLFNGAADKMREIWTDKLTEGFGYKLIDKHNRKMLIALGLALILLGLSYNDKIIKTVDSLRYDPSKSAVDTTAAEKVPADSADQNEGVESSVPTTAESSPAPVDSAPVDSAPIGSAQISPAQIGSGSRTAADPVAQRFNDTLVAASRTDSAEKFFAEYRLERDRLRGQQSELLERLVNDPKTGEAARVEANRKMIALTDALGKELQVETMLKAKNYTDAIVFLQEGAVTVIVQTLSLTPTDITRISDLVSRATGKSAQEMVIIPKN